MNRPRGEKLDYLVFYVIVSIYVLILIPLPWLHGSSLVTSAYNTIESAASALPQRQTLNFVSGCTAADNSGANRTDVTCAGGPTGATGPGGGLTTYAALALTLSGGSTVYVPFGGDGIGSGTESNVQVKVQPALTIKGACVNLSAAPGSGNSIVVTLRDNATAESITMTVSASATSACDSTDTFSSSSGDLLDWSIAPSGVIPAYTPNVMISVQAGYSVSASGGSQVNIISAASCRGNTVTTCVSNPAQSTSDVCAVAIGWVASSSSSVPTATDTVGTSYSTLASTVTISSSTSSVALLGGLCGGTGANTITLVLPSGTEFNGIYPMEFTHVTTTTDGTAHGTNSTSPNTNWNSLATFTTTVAGDLILAIADGQNSNEIGNGAPYLFLNGGACFGGFSVVATSFNDDSGIVCSLIQNSAGFVNNGAWNPSGSGMTVLLVALKHS